jgi:hemoglobin/transferrin/lactoferrin receptor protein
LANIGNGFRAPNIDDMAKVFDSTPGNVVVPNTELKPETVTSFDLGITYTPSRWFKLEVSGFYSLLEDIMIKAPFKINDADSIIYDGELSKVEAIQNMGSGWIFGTQGSFLASLSERFSFKGSIVYTKGEDENGDALRHVTPVFGALHLEYLDKYFRVDLNIQTSGTITYEDLAPSEKDKPYLYASDSNGNPFAPSWYVLNLNASWFISDTVRLVVGIDNILDTRYRSYSSGIAGAGRNYLASLVVHF